MTRLHRKNLLVFVLALAGFPTLSSAQPKERVLGQVHGRFMDASLEVAPEVGYSIRLVNHSSEFVCMDEKEFNTGMGFIWLERKKDDIVGVHGADDMAPELVGGFNINTGYLFIPPKAEHEVFIDFNNFVVKKGETYLVHVVLDYYLCRDIIDLDRAKRGTRPEPHALPITTKVTIEK